MTWMTLKGFDDIFQSFPQMPSCITTSELKDFYRVDSFNDKLWGVKEVEDKGKVYVDFYLPGIDPSSLRVQLDKTRTSLRILLKKDEGEDELICTREAPEGKIWTDKINSFHGVLTVETEDENEYTDVQF